ncbi:MAG: DUF1028 domain-containing protein [Gemmatimonadetes bacterium]|nr:DUF1028 domain-containing protein [Gemmatimonadota bacterium]
MTTSRSTRVTRALAALLMALALTPSAASATWSILAVDVSTGRIVVASATCVAQSRFRDFPAAGLMSIQAVVVPGVGVAAAQAAADRTLANQRLIATELRAGTDPRLILDLLREDPGIAERQFGIVDLQGRSIGFTGSANGPAALARQGRVAGTDIYYAVQGNILASDEVVLDAVRALEADGGDLLEKVMRAMEAADAAGGDRRCTCETEPRPTAPCDGKNAHVAYLLAADRSDPAERPFLYLDVTDENIVPSENANPVITLRMRLDRWRSSSRLR